jgi:hypothetical protein
MEADQVGRLRDILESAHNSAYGTSTSHNEGGATTHTNAYGVKLRVNTEKGLLTRTPMAARRLLNTGRARRIPMFTAAPPLARTARVRITPAPMATALRIIRLPPTMDIIRPRR